ncbi:unnamed protein product [Heligmosomoides polygyrus]|uniref:Myosin motor domain-containing protein n=1 Tax=Heligmosomoides polygyrus TaxID=6339 RepID=A0A183GHX6_HELPZ|nr:unnamed protein product [Heligmosomoides polygyrus]
MEQLQKETFQVEALRQEVEKLQRASKDDDEAAKTRIAGLDLEAIDPKILLEYVYRRIQHQYVAAYVGKRPDETVILGINAQCLPSHAQPHLKILFCVQQTQSSKMVFVVRQMRISLSHDGGTGVLLNQHNELNNEGVRLAKQNSWKNVCAIERQQQKILILLPDGFRDIDTIFKKHNMVERQVYWKLSDVSELLTGSDAHVSYVSTSDVAYAKKEWCELA